MSEKNGPGLSVADSYGSIDPIHMTGYASRVREADDRRRAAEADRGRAVATAEAPLLGRTPWDFGAGVGKALAAAGYTGRPEGDSDPGYAERLGRAITRRANGGGADPLTAPAAVFAAGIDATLRRMGYGSPATAASTSPTLEERVEATYQSRDATEAAAPAPATSRSESLSRASAEAMARAEASWQALAEARARAEAAARESARVLATARRSARVLATARRSAPVPVNEMARG